MHIFIVHKVIIHNIFVLVNENIFIDYTFLLYNGHSRVRLVVVEVKSMSDKKEFKHNNRLKELRKDKGLSQQALAQQIGVHYRTLQNWENGKTHIKPEKAEQLADFFGVSVGYLLGLDTTENDNITDLIAKVNEWAISNGLDKSDPKTQWKKVIDGDMLETIIEIANQLNLLAYEEIKNRRGKMINGTFVKEDDL